MKTGPAPPNVLIVRISAALLILLSVLVFVVVLLVHGIELWPSIGAAAAGGIIAAEVAHRLLGTLAPTRAFPGEQSPPTDAPPPPEA